MIRRRWPQRAAIRIGAAVVVVLGTAPSAGAQGVARVTADSIVSVDHFAGDGGVTQPNVVLDGFASVQLGAGWQAYIRPIVRKPRQADWEVQICQAAVRYERTAGIGVRFDAGYVASPVGLGMLDARATANPLITSHPNYAQFIGDDAGRLPDFDPRAPRAHAIAAIYPLGATLTLSHAWWDTRVAIVDTAPTRLRPVFGENKPRQTPVIEAGAGLTPRQGLRIGMSMALGEYATREELDPPGPRGRSLRLAGFEIEYAVAHTKVSGEWIRDSFETDADRVRAYAWFAEAVQTLTPRWFVAVREEGSSSPTTFLENGTGSRTSHQTVETTAGFRLTPDLTMRAGYFGRKPFDRSEFDHQVGASLVWARRWW